MKKHAELENLFKKFDVDNSGTLDAKELCQMLLKNGINID